MSPSSPWPWGRVGGSPGLGDPPQSPVPPSKSPNSSASFTGPHWTYEGEWGSCSSTGVSPPPPPEAPQWNLGSPPPQFSIALTLSTSFPSQIPIAPLQTPQWNLGSPQFPTAPLSPPQHLTATQGPTPALPQSGGVPLNGKVLSGRPGGCRMGDGAPTAPPPPQCQDPNGPIVFLYIRHRAPLRLPNPIRVHPRPNPR